jgi:hypothetical protein
MEGKSSESFQKLLVPDPHHQNMDAYQNYPRLRKTRRAKGKFCVADTAALLLFIPGPGRRAGGNPVLDFELLDQQRTTHLSSHSGCAAFGGRDGCMLFGFGGP